MNRKKILFLVLLVLLFCGTMPLFAQAEEEAAGFGIVSLIPPLLAIVLAFVTKRVIFSLFLGLLSGSLIVNWPHPMVAFLRTLDQYMVGSLADSWYAGIIIFTLTIGGMVGIVGRMGGTQAIAIWFAKRARSSRAAQAVTSILGVVIFFDDYANTLVVGPTMRPLTDELKVSREKLAYIVDSTAAPVAGLALISTWVGYQIGLIGEAYAGLGIDASPFFVFMRTIPFTFYNIFTLVFIFWMIYLQRDYGPMFTAEKRARLEGKLLGDNAKPMAGDEMTKNAPPEGKPLRGANAVVPILTLLIVGFVSLWYNGYDPEWGVSAFSFEGLRESFGNADASVALIWASVTATIVAIIMATSQKILNLGEAMDAFVGGAKSLLITGIILVLAWSLGSVMGDLGTADYLIQVVSDTLPAGLLPILVFLISMLVAFSTGTSWGTMGIVIPLAVPLAAAYAGDNMAFNPIVLSTLSAVLSGSIFGDHCSPISDTTILSSMASASDHIDHVKTQIPYALTTAGVGAVGYLLVGFLRLPSGIVLLLGIAGLWAIVRFVGKKSDEASLKA